MKPEAVNWEIRHRLQKLLLIRLEKPPKDEGEILSKFTVQKEDEEGDEKEGNNDNINGRSALSFLARVKQLGDLQRRRIEPQDGFELSADERKRMDSINNAYSNEPFKGLFDKLSDALQSKFEELIKNEGEDFEPRLLEEFTFERIKDYKGPGFLAVPFFELNEDLNSIRKIYPNTGSSLCHLSSALFLDGVLLNLPTSVWRKLQQYIEASSQGVLEHFHVEMAGASVADRRQVAAKLLWEAHSPRSSLFRRPEDVLEKAWSRVEEMEGIRPVSEDCILSDLTAEANCILSLVEVLRKTEALRKAYSGGCRLPPVEDQRDTDGNHPTHRVDEDGALDELQNYLLGVLYRRYPPFLAATCAATQAGNSKRLSDHDIALCLHTLTLYLDVVLAPSAARIVRVEKATPNPSSRRELDLESNGAYYPSSDQWTHYKKECLNLAKRINNYAQAFLASESKRMKPFLILVLGPPGTGKSFFVKTVVKTSIEGGLNEALKGNKGYGIESLKTVVQIKSNLAQAASSDTHLDATWRMLFQTKTSGIRLVTLEEFDSRIEGKLEQFRRVLDPLWDGSTQTIQHEAFQSPITDNDLGPYVAVCIMSKVTNLSSARRFLLAAEKGADFLSRIDGVIEIPPFDCPETQLEMAVMAMWSHVSTHSDPRKSALKVSEGAAYFLGWIEANDNYRSIAKALKTIGHRHNEVKYQSLNTGRIPKAYFERALAEATQSTLSDIERALGDSESCTLSLRLVELKKENRHQMIIRRSPTKKLIGKMLGRKKGRK